MSVLSHEGHRKEQSISHPTIAQPSQSIASIKRMLHTSRYLRIF
jgi:hypothetical protein